MGIKLDMHFVTRTLAGTLAFAGIYLLANFGLRRLGIPDGIAYHAAPLVAGCGIGALLGSARAGDRWSIAVCGLLGALVLWIYLTRWDLTWGAVLGTVSAVYGARLAGVRTRWRVPAIAVLVCGLTIGAFAIVFSLYNEPDAILAIMIAMAIGSAVGGFVAQLVVPQRAILICGAGGLGFFVLQVLIGVPFIREVEMVIAFVSLSGPLGALIAWWLRKLGGPAEPFAV